MKIDPDRLKALREANGLSRARLAAASNVSARQIQRLENPNQASRSPREVTMERLAKALNVKPQVLTGEEPLPDAGSLFEPRSVRVAHRLFAEALLAYDLVERRYGVPATAIINAAPLFFVLLAEGSLEWRRKELAEIREAIDNLYNMGDSNRKRFTWAASQADDHSHYEQEAIEKRNLFNDPFPYDYDFPLQDEWPTNPFAEYLRKLSDELDVPGIEVDEGYVSASAADGMPRYSVCKDELEDIAPTNSPGFLALRTCDVRIADIPEHLSPDSAEEERQKWLASKVSKKTIQWLEELDAYWKTDLEQFV